ncbi:MAG: NAD(P)/FAD-dependent oxidoreductase [Clostridia bacterium]|nr:NAD(P)/FAD-dependent oxidoreductase [Clostridia bacterium]
MLKYNVAVVGGGAAGMLAAGSAAENGASVILIEKNNYLGKKLGITGKGRCNLTNSAEMREIMENIPTNPRFLYSAFNAFSNYDIIDLVERYGTKTKVERGGRVFPVSDKAHDVIAAIKKYLREFGVRAVNAEVKEILENNGKITGVMLSDGKIIEAQKVIIATGGVSYPQTGSTGDGFLFAKALGHQIIEPKASLVPMVAEEPFVKDLMGLSLKNIGISVLNENKKVVYSDFGEMIFTHYGVSGPVILSASSRLSDLGEKKYTLKIDLKPALDEKTLDNRLLRDFGENKNKDFINSLGDLLPSKLIPVIVKLSGIDERKKVNLITKPERMALLSLLKGFTLTLTEKRPVSEAIITSGGVNVREINPKTMESKLIQGLYFAGEVIDVDAYTGGFNLQIAFSTGYLAGMSAATN